jgi:hypothetical protein
LEKNKEECMKIIEKLGRAGGPEKREKARVEWNKKYGEGNWEIVYFYNGKIYSRDEAMEEFYNKSYYEYLKNHEETLDKLCNMAAMLYNPHAEATEGVDLQVPAVLRSIEELGRKLQGKEIVAIGTYGYKDGIKYPPISWELSPFRMPLWCDKKLSVEKFWQEYKYLAVKDENKNSQVSLFKETKPDFNIKEEVKDIFTVDDKKYVFGHCIAKDCRMGAGIASQFDRLDFNMKLFLKNKAAVGKTIKYNSSSIGKVYNMVTKDLSWKASRVPGKSYYKDRECIPYDLYLKNLKSCLEDMKNQMIKSGEKYLAMPKIASGLDMCKWEDVKKIIVDVFKNTDINILICVR